MRTQKLMWSFQLIKKSGNIKEKFAFAFTQKVQNCLQYCGPLLFILFVTWCSGVEWCESVVINNRYSIISVETSRFETREGYLTCEKGLFTRCICDFKRLMGHSRGRTLWVGPYVDAILLTAAFTFLTLVFGILSCFLTCQYIAYFYQ